MATDASSVLTQLTSLRSQRELSLLKLSEPITDASRRSSETHNHNDRTSDASSTAADGTQAATTPSSLNADLTHYRDLFTKLRFSYTSQVTKEKFIRSVITSPLPQITGAENLELEKELAELKASLKEQKVAVAGIVEGLEKRARLLVQRQEGVGAQAELLETLPGEIERLKEEIEELRESMDEEVSDDPEMNLALEATSKLVSENQRELEKIDRELATLEPGLDRRMRDLDRVQGEIGGMEAEKRKAVEMAKAAMKRRDEGAGGLEDEIERRGRWLKGVESVMSELLDVR